MDKGSHPLKGTGFRATLKPDLEPDKEASKTPRLTFSGRLLTTSFSPRPWPVLRHRTVDPGSWKKPVERPSLSEMSVFSEVQPHGSKRLSPASLGGGRCSEPGGIEKCRAACRLLEPQQKPCMWVLLPGSEASSCRTTVSGSTWTTVPVYGAGWEVNRHSVLLASI